MRLLLLIPTLFLVPTTLGCRAEAMPRRTAGIVDSVIAPDVALKRFREGLIEPTGLNHGAPTLDSLFASYLGALGKGDTAQMASLSLSRAEFAWLYYPTNPQSKPPYDLDPPLMWFMLRGASDNGLREASNSYGGKPLHYLSGRCEGGLSVQGANRVRGPCTLRFVAGQDTVEDRLLSLVIEREGVFKVVSYSNKLD